VKTESIHYYVFIIFGLFHMQIPRSQCWRLVIKNWSPPMWKTSVNAW